MTKICNRCNTSHDLMVCPLEYRGPYSKEEWDLCKDCFRDFVDVFIKEKSGTSEYIWRAQKQQSN